MKKRMKLKMWALSLVLLTTSSAVLAAGENSFMDLMEGLGELMGGAGTLVIGGTGLLGAVFIVMGVLKIKANREGNQQKQGGWSLVILGAFLGAFSWLYFTSTAQISGEGVDVNAIKTSPFEGNN